MVIAQEKRMHTDPGRSTYIKMWKFRKKILPVAKVGRPYRLFPEASVRHSVEERKRFYTVATVLYTRYGDLLDRTIKSTLGGDMVIWRAWWVINFAFAAKPLQRETWLLLTAYRKSLSPYPTVSAPILYYVLFSHNTRFTDRRRMSQTDDISYRSYGRPKTR